MGGRGRWRGRLGRPRPFSNAAQRKGGTVVWTKHGSQDTHPLPTNPVRHFHRKVTGCRCDGGRQTKP
jgi:hypothetical protein